ncbi:TetR family transcriptional regulator [bacterium]|nr:TetR family transcriptional regulator [bacterium]
MTANLPYLPVGMYNRVYRKLEYEDGMARKTKEEAQETREKILKAALDVFSAKGYSKSTFVDIAEKIGLTKGAVYWHFKNKEDLLFELIITMMTEMDEAVKQQTGGNATIHTLKDNFKVRARVIIENEEFKKFIFFITLQMEWTVEHLFLTNKRLKELRMGFFEEIHRVLAEANEQKLIKDNVNLQQVEDCLISLYMGLVKNAFSGFTTSELTKSIEFGFDAIIQKILVN